MMERSPQTTPPLSPPVDDAAQDRRRQAGRAGVVGSATMTSRILGLFREHVFAKLFGTDALSDAFVMAYRIPNLLRDLFAEGALSSAFVPSFAECREQRGQAAAFRLAQTLFSFIFLVVGALTVAGVVFAPQIVNFIAPGFQHVIESQTTPGGGVAQRDTTIRLTQILMPFLLLVSLAAACRGILNSYHRYFLPAVSPALFNLVAVITGLGMYWAGMPPETAVYGWALATLGGGLVQLLIQLPAVRTLGLRLRPAFAFRDPSFRRLLKLLLPATLGLAAVQVNVLVNSVLASLLTEGSATWLQLAFRLVYLPIGVVGVAVATVASVNLSALAAKRDMDRFRTDLMAAVRLVAFLTIPASVGLIVLGQPIVRLIYEYGRFSAESTTPTALALGGYSLGLVFYSAIKTLAPALYALDRVRAPMLASVAGVAVNVVWSLLTYRTFGVAALAIGTSLAALVNCAVLAVALRRELGGSGPRDLSTPVTLAKTLALGVLMGVIVSYSHDALVSVLGSQSFLARATAISLCIVVGTLVMGLGGVALRVPEARDLWATIRRRA
ncbi:MAG: murein biosynthesis integral membrane protein MurJ [Planctomycetota bacterium]